MKILFSFVGDQDPISDRTDSEGSVITLAKRIDPDEVVLFCQANRPGAKKNMEHQAELTRDWLVDELGYSRDNIYIRPMALEDPRDFKRILPQGRKIIRDFINNFPVDYSSTAVVNSSSGTPQMKTCWFLWASGGVFAPLIPALYQVSAPEHAQEDNRVSLVDFAFMEEENSTIRFQKYLEDNYFYSAGKEADNIKSISAYMDRRNNADIAKTLCWAYHQWDLLNYNEALKFLRQIKNQYEGVRDFANIIPVIEDQIEVLSELKDSSEDSVISLIDVYYNGLRRFKQGGYAETLARVWRLNEGCFFYLLRNKFGIEPSDLNKSRNPENKREAKAFLGDKKNLSLYLSRKLLEEVFQDGSFIDFLTSKKHFSWGEGKREMNIKEGLEKLTKKRHSSIVAHGMESVSRDIGRLGLELGEEMLKFTLKEEEEKFATFPFMNIGELIGRIF